MKHFDSYFLSKIAFFIFIIASALYIELPYVGKLYIPMLMIGLVVQILSLSYRRKIPFEFLMLLTLLLFLVFTIKMLLSSEPFLHLYVINVALTFFVYFAMKPVSYNDILKGIRLYLYVSLPVFLYEAIYRFLNPTVGGQNLEFGEQTEGSTFYMYKVNSLMYTNSNGVGMNLTFIIGLILALILLQHKTKIFSLKLMSPKSLLSLILVYELLVLLTLSRAAILVSILTFIIFFILRYKLFKFISVFMSPVVALLIAFAVISLMHFSDSSLLTKFEIAENLKLYLDNASVSQILFGNTLNDPIDIFPYFVGFYGHTHYFDLIFKGGLLFTLTYLSVLIFPFFYARSYYIFFLVPFFILGFSNIRVFAHYIFLLLPIYYVLFSYNFRRGVC